MRCPAIDASLAYASGYDPAGSLTGWHAASLASLVSLAFASGFDFACSAEAVDVDDPIAFFLTIATYGTWLPGDARGWVEYRHGWQLPDPVRELESRARMSEDACLLTASERVIVERQVAETCQHRGWTLHAVNCRSNHLHAVIGASGVPPKKIRADIKAWCTRRLKERSASNQAKPEASPSARSQPEASVRSTGRQPEASARAARESWWAERGSIRWIFDDEGLETVVLYATAAQDRKHLDQ